MESIVSLTRRGATCTELLTCLYDLKQMDMDVLYETARKERVTLDEISDSVKRDRSTVHRSLSKLVSLNLVYKRMRTLKDGGYYHVYIVAEESQIEKQVNLRVKEIIESLEKLVDRFASDFHRQLRIDRR
jgi:predicted transcriptional regulator